MPKKSPWVREAPHQDVGTHARAGGEKPVMLHVYVPRALREQSHELARELSVRNGRSVSMSDVVRMALRDAIKKHLQGV